jgi:hypothetical protein
LSVKSNSKRSPSVWSGVFTTSGNDSRRATGDSTIFARQISQRLDDFTASIDQRLDNFRKSADKRFQGIDQQMLEFRGEMRQTRNWLVRLYGLVVFGFIGGILLIVFRDFIFP